MVTPAPRPTPIARQLARVGLAAVAGYLLGTAPSAVLASRLVGGVDPRQAGTGNPGAANVAATNGKALGLAVLLADVGKSALAASVGGALLGPQGRHLGSFASVVGHCHPVWSGLRGGKGVATSVGQVLMTFPVYMPIDAAVAIGTAAVPKVAADAERTVALSSSVWTLAATAVWRRGWSNPGGPPPTVWLPLAAGASSAVILGRFRSERRAVADARDRGETWRNPTGDPEER